MAYTLECDRLAAVLPDGDADRKAFFHKRAALGDAEFYMNVLTLPDDLALELAMMITGGVKACKAEIDGWRAKYSAWRNRHAAPAPAIGSELWRAGVMLERAQYGEQVTYTRVTKCLTPPVTLPLWRELDKHFGYRSERQPWANMWRAMRRTYGAAVARDAWLLITTTYRATVTQAERAEEFDAENGIAA